MDTPELSRMLLDCLIELRKIDKLPRQDAETLWLAAGEVLIASALAAFPGRKSIVWSTRGFPAVLQLGLGLPQLRVRRY